MSLMALSLAIQTPCISLWGLYITSSVLLANVTLLNMGAEDPQEHGPGESHSAVIGDVLGQPISACPEARFPR